MNKYCIICSKKHNNKKFCSVQCYYQYLNLLKTKKKRSKTFIDLHKIKQFGFQQKNKYRFQKNRIPWNKGLTKETDERVRKSAEKLSKTNTGHKASLKTRKKMSKQRKGKPTWLSNLSTKEYQYMINTHYGGKPPARKYDGKTDALSIKRRFFEKIEKKGYLGFDEYPCECCGRTSGTIFDLHHIIFRSERPYHKKLHHIDNILYVCRYCHDKFHRDPFFRNDIVRKRKLDKIFNLKIVEKTSYEK